ncbi:MAG: dephospho-CoA kinase [Rickettsiales bacterium]|nr:dephospho-CoA kinase [Rickettsiales bacterium]
MTLIIGLTGSIAMGKTTVATQLAELGARVSDADAVVHQLLAEDKELILHIAKIFPNTVEEGRVNRKSLGVEVFADEAKLTALEKLLHPKVRTENVALIKQAKTEGWPLLVLEIPLLFETGAQVICDKVIVVSCSPEMQRARAMAREWMTEDKFQKILARQMPDAEKRKRADEVIDTSNGLESSKTQLEAFISKL